MTTLLTKIEPNEIKLLEAATLVKLLHRLLLCEARDMSISQPGILVPYEITVPDGGSDAEWRVKSNIENFVENEFIPRVWTRYQCKAERITESVCRKEIAPLDKDGKLVVKARVREVLEGGGCYAFFTTGHEVKPSKEDDIETISIDQLLKAGFVPGDKSLIEFYGCNKIADWVNKFPSAVRYVREITKGFGGVHYYTFDGWSRLADVSGDFFENESIREKINGLRNALLNGGARLVRVTGLSGLGKTRMVYEALKPSGVGVLQEALSASCIYISYESASADIVGMVGHLADNGYAAVVVIDDCPAAIHDRIANIVENSSLTVITVFHEPQQERRDSHILNLEPDEMRDVVEQILRGDPALAAKGDSAIKAVASFSQGFPKIAKLIVEFQRSPSLEELGERAQMFHKLLSKGEDPDSVTLLTAQVLSLFSSIGGSTAKLELHLNLIRDLFCPEMTEINFRRSIESQRKRRIVQQIADTLTLAPRPLGVALAADFISFFPANRWRSVIDSLAKAELLTQFQNRIEELEFSEQADELGRMLLEVGLPFKDAEYLLIGTTGARMFRSLSALCPSAAIKIAKRVISGVSIDRLRELFDSRRDIVLALELLAWEVETFHDAVELLIRLAAAENEPWSNNATGAVKQLYNVYLSGTKLPAMDRLSVIENSLGSSESLIRQVAIAALGAALNFRHFSRTGGGTISGKRAAEFDWRPQSNREALDYWRQCFKMLASLIDSNDKESAKEVLGLAIGVVLQTPLILELESEFKEICDKLGNVWPPVKDQIKSILEILEGLSKEHRDALVRYQRYLTPGRGDVSARIRDIVSSPGWHHHKEEGSHYVDVSRNDAEEFGEDLSREGVDLTPFLKQLLVGEQQQAFAFGVAIGSRHPDATKLIEQVLDMWPALNEDERNRNFGGGLIRALSSDLELKSHLLDKISYDPNLVDLLAYWTSCLDVVSEADFIRVRKAIVESRLEPVNLRYLVQGLPLRSLSSEFLEKEIALIDENNKASAPFLLHLLFSHCFNDKAKFNSFRQAFRRLLLSEKLELADSHFSWEWHEVAVNIIKDEDDDVWLSSLAGYICSKLLNSKSWVRLDNLQKVTERLFDKAPQITWPPFAEMLVSGDDFNRYLFRRFLGKSGSRFDNVGSPMWVLPSDLLGSWASSNKRLIPMILEDISLYFIEKGESGEEIFQWHPNALVLLKEGEDEVQLAEALIANLVSFGSVGSRVPYIQKRIELVRLLSSQTDAKLKRIAKTLESWLSDELAGRQREELNDQARFQ